MECWPELGEAGLGMQMKLHVRRWLLGLAMLFVFAGVYTPPQADAQVVVKVGQGHHRRPQPRHRRHRRPVRR
jgi:hypothetical protein